MIINRYDRLRAEEWREAAGSDPADRDLGERVYTSRLIGRNPDLVMHGGGNTSVKVERPGAFGENERVIHVKGSGWDLDVIEASGLPGLWLEPLKALRSLDGLGDEAMVNAQRSNLLDSRAPNPSVETLLHAFLPHKYVDHTHATPFLVLANLPDAVEVCREIFGRRLGIVPYLLPGFALAKKAAEVFEEDPSVEGMLLLNHGHFAFGDTARQSYERIVGHTNEAAAFVGMAAPTRFRERRPTDLVSVLPELRGAVAKQADGADAPMPAMDLRNGREILDFFNRRDAEELAARGTASPDHVIRIKGKILVLRERTWSRGRGAIERRYFKRLSAAASEPKICLSPEPKLALIEGVGLVGLGADAGKASIAADLGEQNLRVRSAAEDAGGYQPLGEQDSFDVEYWSLEQAKLGKGKAPRFLGRIVVVTGGAGAIGLETAKSFAKEGANCLIVDIDRAKLDEALDVLGRGHAAIDLDIAEPGAPAEAVRAAALNFGGLDILVSNAGSATTGAMIDLPEEELRRAFEVNFFAHWKIASEAARMMRLQGRGGQILFNVSKQAVNPGVNFGAYGIPKAATMLLLRQLALELGKHRIRVNGINADRVRSGLMTEGMIDDRASARGLTADEYMKGNLLEQEVTAAHVAQAFVALASCERTTAHVLTVDGGNIEAALR